MKIIKKYRTRSLRLKGHDYGKNGTYFITICTMDRIPHFKILNNTNWELSESGGIVIEIWQAIPEFFPYVQLGEFVLMPNHIHGIIKITKSVAGEVPSVGKLPFNEDVAHGGFTGIQNLMLHQNLGRVVRWFKGRCTYEIRKVNPDFSWQRNYYEHIVRDEKALENIENYIKRNPDKFDM
ncbi:MAG: hypothetical protein IPN29_12335 [Saprospiraceae bacterium]|nr:hypothetical protein [Saprospiraceae bacterium]